MTQDLTIPTQILNVTVFDPLGQPLPNTQVGVSNDVLSLPFSLFPGASSNTVNENTSGKTDTNGIVHLALVPISSITLNAFPPSGSKLSRKTLQTSFLGTKNIVIEYNVISVGAITVSTNPTQINTPITTSSSFVDTSTLNTHTASWDWGDGNTTIGTVTENSGSGSISDTHTFTTPGVYTIKLNVTDNYGSVGTNTFQYVSVYNPTPQGLFSGARIFTSPIGAYPQNTSLTGKVMFGVSVKYSGTTPTGNVSMNFKTANLTFDATSISTLVTASGAATVRGSGTLNSSGGYTFLATGLDSNSGGPTIRFQIKDSSNAVVYDSQPGAADDATPTTAVTGHVVVH
ncbi:PKD domain-containing protein [Candidatus Gottesmanbacteria bacterium]|nr:PKD domain-containing protein [Candidatus Gottesmanbacteria bacterium]